MDEEPHRGNATGNSIIIIIIIIIIITQRAVDLACEKGASNWLTVIPLKDMDFDLNKREFRDAVRLRCD